MIWTIPNIITLIRIMMIPLFVVAFYIPFPHHHGVSSSLFLLAAATDWLDGFIARYTDKTTKLGAFLDPVADKLMVAAALVLLVALYPYWWVAVPAIVIVCREIVVSALREWMAEIGQRTVIKVSFIGKIKTVSQMASIFMLLLKPVGYNIVWSSVAFTLLYVAVFLTVYSMWLYLRAAYLAIKIKE